AVNGGPEREPGVAGFALGGRGGLGINRGGQEAGQPVRLTVEAFPGGLFRRQNFQIRKSSTTTQNVVTYPVVVSAPNADLKLLPGMTATISFQLREKANVLRVPNAALRFYPQLEQVRREDRKILESTAPTARGRYEGGTA